jgi:hypothetical protein
MVQGKRIVVDLGIICCRRRKEEREVQNVRDRCYAVEILLILVFETLPSCILRQKCYHSHTFHVDCESERYSGRGGGKQQRRKPRLRRRRRIRRPMASSSDPGLDDIAEWATTPALNRNLYVSAIQAYCAAQQMRVTANKSQRPKVP